jgi:hypothetical protein
VKITAPDTKSEKHDFAGRCSLAERISKLTASRDAFRSDDQNKHQGPKNKKAVGMQPAKGEYRVAHFVVRLGSMVWPPKVISPVCDLSVHSIATEVGGGN